MAFHLWSWSLSYIKAAESGQSERICVIKRSCHHDMAVFRQRLRVKGRGTGMRWIMALYLTYLAAPIVLLLVGSFGESWTNSLLPSGITDRWYLEIWADGSFRRAFSTSLIVCGATCVASVL